MHELSVAQDIIELARLYLPNQICFKNIYIRIEVGTFKNILPELLEFGFNVLTKDTELDGAKLVIEKIPLTVKCNDCGGISEIEPTFFYCSYCSGSNVEIKTGNELQVKEIEIIEN